MLNIVLIAHDKPSTIIHPSIAPFYFSALCALSDLNRGLDTPPSELLAKHMAVITLIDHQLHGLHTFVIAPSSDFNRRQSGLGQYAFMLSRTHRMQPNRVAIAIGNN